MTTTMAVWAVLALCLLLIVQPSSARNLRAIKNEKNAQNRKDLSKKTSEPLYINIKPFDIDNQKIIDPTYYVDDDEYYDDSIDYSEDEDHLNKKSKTELKVVSKKTSQPFSFNIEPSSTDNTAIFERKYDDYSTEGNIDYYNEKDDRSLDLDDEWEDSDEIVEAGQTLSKKDKKSKKEIKVVSKKTSEPISGYLEPPNKDLTTIYELIDDDVLSDDDDDNDYYDENDDLSLDLDDESEDSDEIVEAEHALSKRAARGRNGRRDRYRTKSAGNNGRNRNRGNKRRKAEKKCRGAIISGGDKCDRSVQKYYYDAVSDTCKPFENGDCNASKNNWGKYEKCVKFCVKGSKPKF